MDTSIIPPFRKCPTCKRDLPKTAEFFCRNKKRQDFAYECKECDRARNKAWREKNAERHKEYNRNYHATHREKLNRRSREYYREHHAEMLKQSRVKYWSDPQAAIEYQHNYRKENPQKIIEQRRKHYHKVKNTKAFKDMIRNGVRMRRARKRQADGVITQQDIDLQLRSQRGKCWWCLKKLKDAYDVDHVIPLSRGGSNRPENIVIACPSCNRRKNNKLPQEWNGRLF